MSAATGWMVDAACKQSLPSDFYPDSPSEVPLEAARLCRGCAVREECRSYALAYERYGVWAGLSEEARDDLRRRYRIVVRSPQTGFMRTA